MAEWHVLVQKVLPYVVAIETPEGSGTGFLFAYNDGKTLMAFATAAHVVQHADAWKQPIKLRHHLTGSELFLSDDDRYIELDSSRDSASILISRKGDYWPADLLPMMDPEQFKSVGVEVGWVGYPGIASPNLCFFTGRVSAFVAHDDSYLIDGVAINGVSGGPVFAELPGHTPELVGTISAYIPNRQRGDALPGMLQAHDITTFQETIKTIRSLDEARAKKEEEDRQRRQAEASGEIAPPTHVPPPQEPDA